jgi:transposase
METLHERCAGLDVHKDTVVACTRIATGRSAQRDLKTFATTTSGLLELHDWLAQHEVTHVAIEATAREELPAGRINRRPPSRRPCSERAVGP